MMQTLWGYLTTAVAAIFEFVVGWLLWPIERALDALDPTGTLHTIPLFIVKVWGLVLYVVSIFMSVSVFKTCLKALVLAYLTSILFRLIWWLLKICVQLISYGVGAAKTVVQTVWGFVKSIVGL